MIDRLALNTARLAPLFPPLIAKANTLIADCSAQGVNILITQGLRTWREQDALYAQGRTTPGKIVTNAKGGQSYHNFGLAFDICPIDAAGKPIWDTTAKEWKLAWEIGDLHQGSALTSLDSDFVASVIAQDLGLQEGNDWSKFKDPPHYELTGGVSLALLRISYKPDLTACWQEVESRLNK